MLWLLHVHGRFLRSAEVIQFGVTGEFSHKFFPHAGRGFRYDVEQYQNQKKVGKRIYMIDRMEKIIVQIWLELVADMIERGTYGNE